MLLIRCATHYAAAGSVTIYAMPRCCQRADADFRCRHIFADAIERYCCYDDASAAGENMANKALLP